MNTNTVPASPEYVRRLDMTFTDSGLQLLKAYRDRVAHEAALRITLGQALDALIKSHPFATGSAEVSA